MTDSAGQYAMEWSQINGTHPVLVRACGASGIDWGQAEFTRGGGRVPLDFAVSPETPCAPLSRPPWDVGPSDTTAISGYLIYSWEGTFGGFLQTCDGKVLGPSWPPGTALWDHNPEEGERQFVRLVGRGENDPESAERPIGFPTFYIREVLERRPVQPEDCPVE